MHLKSYSIRIAVRPGSWEDAGTLIGPNIAEALAGLKRHRQYEVRTPKNHTRSRGWILLVNGPHQFNARFVIREIKDDFQLRSAT